LNGWTIVGGTSNIGKKTQIPIAVPGRARYFMLWITRLVQTGGHYQATVDDFKLLR
jgi:hypothetical protein